MTSRNGAPPAARPCPRCRGRGTVPGVIGRPRGHRCRPDCLAIIARYEAGMAIREIERRHGLTGPSVYAILEHHAIPRTRVAGRRAS